MGAKPTGKKTKPVGFVPQPAGRRAKPAGKETLPAGFMLQPPGKETQPTGFALSPPGKGSGYEPFLPPFLAGAGFSPLTSTVAAVIRYSMVTSAPTLRSPVTLAPASRAISRRPVPL